MKNAIDFSRKFDRGLNMNMKRRLKVEKTYNLSNLVVKNSKAEILN